ncbi:hypothetical protein Aoki45_32350 [Algoriphagus sp. oki45]|uniref:Uncharacterized protein n=1 Tax=Algoriphagus taiwanensis TaxID=1445656 RepID=A0ABQ6Q407_9BACT|nr:hypothetical protein Aoki45_32350 [Algoriphagus sp. oki45]GMQ34602.1 hypothetical protein Ataiwa_28750 [Algoriphagus taiwanensis]
MDLIISYMIIRNYASRSKVASTSLDLRIRD